MEYRKTAEPRKRCVKGVSIMIRVLMMLAMAVAAYLVATMDQGVKIELDD